MSNTACAFIFIAAGVALLASAALLLDELIKACLQAKARRRAHAAREMPTAEAHVRGVAAYDLTRQGDVAHFLSRRSGTNINRRGE
jgi:hypothetical protein